MVSILKQLNAEMDSVVGRAGSSLVQVRNRRGGAGAGTIWHPDGLVITNAHVVQGDYPQVALRSGESLPARLLAHDAKRDIAALMVNARELPTIDLGESLKVKPGQWVMAMGHPWGVKGAATAGVVIGLESEAHGLPHAGREWLAVNMQLRPGHSGGPLMDVEGRLIGINTIMNGPDVGMAVPVHVVKRFLKDKLGSDSI